LSDDGEDFPFILIFIVVSAFLTAFILITIYNKQVAMKIDEKASGFVTNLSWTAFQSFSTGVLGKIDLPKNIEGYNYRLKIHQNAFVLELLEGPLRGKSYIAGVPFDMISDNLTLPKDETVFFKRSGEKLLVCFSVLESIENENINIEPNPPEFYFFAKDHPKEAAGILAAFFYSGKDIVRYSWLENHVLYVMTEDNESFILTFRRDELQHDIHSLQEIETPTIEIGTERIEAEKCPSPAEALLKGWIISPELALASLRSRTWIDQNGPVGIPANAEISMSCVFTKFGGYPTWRISFENRTIFHRALFWWHAENEPGFLMQCSPVMYPID